MKRIRYTTAAILLSAFLTATPTMATAPAAVSSADQPAASSSEAVVAQDPPAAIKEAAETIVARVEGVDINKLVLINMMNKVAKIYYKDVKEPTAEIALEIKKKALDRLIFEELAFLEAMRQEIKIPQKNIETVIKNLKIAYETEEGYQGYLDSIGLTEDGLRARILRGHLLQTITAREVYAKVTVDEKEYKKLYKEYQDAGKLMKADKFTVKDVLLMDNEDKESVRENANKLLAELKKNGNDFGKLMLDGTFIVRRLPVIQRRNPVIYEQMQNMEIGQLSGVVEDGGTFHIFKVLERELARDLTEKEARDFLENRLLFPAQEKKRAEWMEELRKDAKIEILDKDLL